jgi:hypothetical protein
MSAGQKAQSPGGAGQSAEKNTINASSLPDEIEFHTTAAKFARKGHALHRSTRPADGHATFILSNWGQSRAFSNWGDVTAFLTLIGGAA